MLIRFLFFCVSLFILKFVRYLLLFLFHYMYLIEMHRSDFLTDLRVQVESGTFLVANLHGDLKQLFVMIQISRDVEILQVVWRFNMQNLCFNVDILISKWTLYSPCLARTKGHFFKPLGFSSSRNLKRFSVVLVISNRTLTKNNHSSNY